MKVFVPISDDVLSDNGEVCPSLIPFDLSMLSRGEELGDDKKPNNWLSSSEVDYGQQSFFSVSV